MPIWNRVEELAPTAIYELSECIALANWRHPNTLTSVTDGRMIIASDYSGQHQDSRYETFSFLVTSHFALQDWFPQLSSFRKRWLPDGRRISYKQLRDRTRWRALPPYLESAGNIRGNLISILCDKKIKSLSGYRIEEIIEIFPDCFDNNTPLGTAEKMFRISAFIAMLIAGFRREKQESLWLSDNDEILSTDSRRDQVGRLASYISFGLRGWKNPSTAAFGTTGSPFCPSWAEDLISIPDLVAGAYNQMGDLLPAFCGDYVLDYTKAGMAYYPSRR